jgi:TRAP-type C4-dicarboxylate transport system substrate-binding protein
MRVRRTQRLLARLSHGSITIVIANRWRDLEVGYEKGIVADVRRNKVELGIVGVRVWDTIGVTSFRALLAPFLIDSLALERQVLAGPLPNRMLPAIAHAGVVGLAVMPGTLRRPLGITRPLVGVEDYKGATIGIPTGGLAAATFAALAATAKGYTPGTLTGLDGAELDLSTIASDYYDLTARALTANVVLWPRVQTVSSAERSTRL